MWTIANFWNFNIIDGTAPDNVNEKETTIGINKEVFAPYDFSSLPDITV